MFILAVRIEKKCLVISWSFLKFNVFEILRQKKTSKVWWNLPFATPKKLSGQMANQFVHEIFHQK